MRLTILAIILLVPILFFGQVPGKALKLEGASQYIDFGEVLGGVRSVSFWINLSEDIDSTAQSEVPILVRDNDGPSTFSTGEFAIYFGKTGSPEAGHLVFNRATEFVSHKIKSDRNSWEKHEWFHIAAVLHPQNGMRLYINGVLQQETHSSTNPVYMRQEGTTGPLYLGKWGNVSGFGIKAEFDELRFYTNAQTGTQIKSSMCRIESPTNSLFKGYYDFDYATLSFTPTLAGIITGQATGLTASSLLKSNAPVGELSSYIYNFSSSSNLIHSSLLNVELDSMISNAKGVHIYSTGDLKLNLIGSIPEFYGIWFTEPIANYRVDFDYNSSSVSCDSCSEISSREFQTTPQWNVRSSVQENCHFVLDGESPGNLSHREEYWVKPKLDLKTGLKDTVTQCEGDVINLTAINYAGARYLWNDGLTQSSRSIDSTGKYYLTVKWHGCEVTDTVHVIYQYRPYFQLPNDTAICIGDTFVIKAPLDIDSAVYMWGNGIHFGRNFRMYYAGTIQLRISVGDCYWEDEITVDLIKKFPLNLGKDTTLCLGQELVLSVPPDVDYVWSTGSTSESIRVFNQPQKVWVEAWNSCFYRTDTVSIDYEECDCNFYVANSFTPNDDGINDIFHPVSDCFYEEFEMQIFDRWGKMVFETDDFKRGWDGLYKGRMLPEGVYTYQLRYKKYTWLSMSQFQRGTITLLF